MKLQELIERRKSTRGTYAAVNFDKQTIQNIEEYLKENKIPGALKSDKLHTTLLYSRKFLPDYKGVGQYESPIVGTPAGFVVWKTKPDDGSEPARCLVLKYDCPELVKRHKLLMKEHNATYDYDEYHPHITLSYDIGDMNEKNLPDIQKYVDKIVIISEYHEDLNLNWAKTKASE